MSREVASGRATGDFVNWRFCCCIRRWPLLVASDLGRCFLMSDSLRPGHEEKWPRRIARRKVEGDGLKAQPCKNAASSPLVLLVRIMLVYIEIEMA